MLKTCTHCFLWNNVGIRNSHVAVYTDINIVKMREEIYKAVFKHTSRVVAPADVQQVRHHDQ